MDAALKERYLAKVKPTADALEAAAKANMDAYSTKLFSEAGPLHNGKPLMAIKDIEHRVRVTIQHEDATKKKEKKVLGISWGTGASDLEVPRLGVVGQSGACFVYNTLTKKKMYGVAGPDSKFAQCMAIAPSSDSPLVLVGTMRNATTLFRKNPVSAIMQKSKQWIKHDGYISSLHFLSDSTYISASGDAEIRVFDMNADPSGNSLQRLIGHEKDAQCIKFPRDVASKDTFITCSTDKTVKLWDLRVGACAQTFKTSTELNSCCIFPDGNILACGGMKDKTYVFDVRACRKVGDYARNNQETSSCEFSRSGRELYVGHADGSIIVWDIFADGANKNYAKKIEAHTQYDEARKISPETSRVNCLEVGPRGYLASGGFDGAVKIWGSPKPM